MMASERPVVGIDVGVNKGYHVVLLQGNEFTTRKPFHSASEVAQWCDDVNAAIVAVDAPCKWAFHGKSRQCERELEIGDAKIHSFKTPQEFVAKGRPFYEWVRRGQLLYSELKDRRYELFECATTARRIMIETFPNAVVCALEGRVVKARPKARTRRDLLSRLGYDHSALPSIDHVDAALCALAAYSFENSQYRSFGQAIDGLIVVPVTGYPNVR
ncbi:MAG: DUF429 domain-containing protein [Ignavibacteria bacterium]|nr:DUF429 domain-containing protein [Ignavibacteria bacterium]